jgi:hypothetical protein
MSTAIFQEAVVGVAMMKVWSWFKKFERWGKQSKYTRK